MDQLTNDLQRAQEERDRQQQAIRRINQLERQAQLQREAEQRQRQIEIDRQAREAEREIRQQNLENLRQEGLNQQARLIRENSDLFQAHNTEASQLDAFQASQRHQEAAIRRQQERELFIQQTELTLRAAEQRNIEMEHSRLFEQINRRMLEVQEQQRSLQRLQSLHELELHGRLQREHQRELDRLDEQRRLQQMASQSHAMMQREFERTDRTFATSIHVQTKTYASEAPVRSFDPPPTPDPLPQPPPGIRYKAQQSVEDPNYFIDPTGSVLPKPRPLDYPRLVQGKATDGFRPFNEHQLRLEAWIAGGNAVRSNPISGFLVWRYGRKGDIYRNRDLALVGEAIWGYVGGAANGVKYRRSIGGGTNTPSWIYERGPTEQAIQDLKVKRSLEDRRNIGVPPVYLPPTRFQRRPAPKKRQRGIRSLGRS
ncbi:MAG: hypothetical protein AAFN63_07815 [Pseudomonadota bacterium]